MNLLDQAAAERTGGCVGAILGALCGGRRAAFWSIAAKARREDSGSEQAASRMKR